MRCVQCKNQLLQKSGGRVRVRIDGPVIFTDHGTCQARCYWCKSPVELPMVLEKSLEIPEETFLLRR